MIKIDFFYLAINHTMSNKLISQFEVDNYYKYHTIVVSIIIIGALIAICFRVQEKSEKKHKRQEIEIEEVRHEIKKLNNDIHNLEVAITKYVSGHTKKQEDDMIVKLLGFKCEFLLCLTDDEKQDIKSNIHLDQEFKESLEKYSNHRTHQQAEKNICDKYSLITTCRDILSEFTQYQDFYPSYVAGERRGDVVTNKILYKKIGKALYAYLYVWDYLRKQITLNYYTYSYFSKPINTEHYVNIGGMGGFNTYVSIDLRQPIVWTEY